MLFKKLFCKHNLLTYVRPLTKDEIVEELKKNRTAEYLFRCNKCGKLVRK